jgi:hypothetical protein
MPVCAGSHSPRDPDQILLKPRESVVNTQGPRRTSTVEEGTVNNETSRMWMGIAGCALVFGFFMPWIDIAGFGGLSGWELVRESNLSMSTRFVLALCPLLGIAMALTSFTKSNAAGTVSALTGAAVIGYTLFKIAYAFVKITGWGLWLVLAAGLIALIVGLAARSKS